MQIKLISRFGNFLDHPESSTGSFFRIRSSRVYDHHVTNPRSLNFWQLMQLSEFNFIVEKNVMPVFHISRIDTIHGVKKPCIINDGEG